MRRRWLYILLAVLLVAALAGAARILYPPVSVVVMTTGPAGSAYDVFARQYHEILAREGIDLRLEASAGSVENLLALARVLAGTRTFKQLDANVAHFVSPWDGSFTVTQSSGATRSTQRDP